MPHLAVVLLCALSLLASAATGALAMWLLVNHRIEAMHALMVSTRPGPYRRQRADEHLAAWRGAVRRWVLLHLPHLGRGRAA